MPVTLGYSPTRMTLSLVAGADFAATLRSQNGSTWPGTANATIEVGTATWTATVSGTDLQFNVDQIDVDAVIAEAPKSFKLWYEDGPTRLLWANGPVLVSNG